MFIKPLIFGILSTALTFSEKELFQKNRVYGFILFQRNIENREKLVNLIKELKSLYPDYRPKILIDQEGGRVARLKPPIIPHTYPAVASFGTLYNKQGKKVACDAVYKNYAQLMQDLKKLGIDSPCAPVADLHFSFTNQAIGDRSFGNDVSNVVDLCTEAIRAIKDQGGIPILKHIPGHGRATIDSHFQLPHVDTTLEVLNNSDFEIFRKLSNDSQDKEKNWAMSAHILYKSIDNAFPVTLSSKAIRFIRDEIGFKGTIISDAIEMGALHGDLGLRYQLVTQMLSINNSNDKSRKQFDEFVNKCIDQGVIKDKNDLSALREQRDQIKSDFACSIANLANQALEAGCDLVLHCNGDIAQMKQICAVVEERDLGRAN
ncbi:glycoside hydrolase family 3 N-terminal domain-containing protein [Cardinium endosymbiont of Tipula unca]|uniref:glycoside hydrolase family 3 N-terminal domain-containing protein n=1 Tax=Cardinium endosymbiont of Tipula unca TaxID=3066216 RepID=UPI0030CA6664